MPSQRHRRPLLHSGFRAALLAGVAAELVVSVARAFDVPMRAGAIGAATPVTLPPGLVGLEAAIGVLAGAIIANALSRWSRHPRRSFLRLATTLTALSLVSPIAAGATTTATKVTLTVAHFVVAAIAIPILSRALPVDRPAPQQATAARGTSPVAHTHTATSSSQPTTEPNIMSLTMTNPAIPAAMAILEAINTGNLDLIDDAVTPTFVDHDAPYPIPPGPAGYRQVLGFVTRVLKVTYTLEEIFATHDRIIIRATAHGRGVEQIHGPGTHDKPFTMRTVHIYATDGQRLAEHWGQRDEFGVRRQLASAAARR